MDNLIRYGAGAMIIGMVVAVGIGLLALLIAWMGEAKLSSQNGDPPTSSFDDQYGPVEQEEQVP